MDTPTALTLAGILNPEIMLGAAALAVAYRLGVRALDIAERAVDTWKDCRACKERRDA